MDKKSLVERIFRLKKERNATILAHNYQIGDVQDIADFLGDSLDLSIKASQVMEDVIVFCGVHFMAETAAILAPEKTVLIPDFHAGCPMANMMEAKELIKNPKHPYSKLLLKSVPNINSKIKKPKTIKGTPPDLLSIKPFCSFALRCPFSKKICFEKKPPYFTLEENTKVACWLYKNKEKIE